MGEHHRNKCKTKPIKWFVQQRHVIIHTEKSKMKFNIYFTAISTDQNKVL